MIEMRWVKKYVPAGRGTVRIERVLQYRYRKSPHEKEGLTDHWSEWIDVPEVKDSEHG